ncbi:sulfotransferase domain-containing protein [Salinibacter ruber]|uniref:sulfotransferase domain-containing protein n=1 Tax=Salinibacter ruber TaxID=146919 RepID=UPI0021697BA5|nr:sulfotransferase domain-containing protein [Salinibacter ruber]MCS3685475.1 hypothetical protein [Salinibacter ruber]
MSKKKNIVVVGYPKSGTTWLTRLTAELVQCPVEGFWGEPEHEEPAIEGQNRVSQYRCYKAHHDLSDLRSASKKSIDEILYIVRDPRDVVVSGRDYFDPPRFHWFEEYVVRKIFRRIPGLEKLYDRVFHSQDYRTRRMVNAVLYGQSHFDWCKIPWATHVRQYMNSEALVVRYEDLLETPRRECERILDHLECERSDEHIHQSILNQSIDKKKKELKEKGEEVKLSVMNKGGGERWKHEMDSRYADRVLEENKKPMKIVGYVKSR